MYMFDPPYGAFGLTCPENHNGGSAASKGILAVAGENKEGFTWICKMPNLDQRRKHYKSFWRGRLKISVHDFVFIKGGGRESHVAYVEDMYEDASGKKMVQARWFEEQDGEHGAVVPSDLYRREIFFGYGLQDLRVEFVEGMAAVLNPEHFEMFKKIHGGHSSWQPFVCRRQIEDDIVGPFDIAQQLQGYAKQEIVKAIVVASSSTVVHARPPNNKGKASVNTGLAAENHVGSSRTVIDDKPMQKRKLPPCSVTPSSSLIGDKTMEKQKPPPSPCSATPSSSVMDNKTMKKQKPPQCSATPPTSSSDKAMEKQKPPVYSATPSSTIIDGKTMEKQKPPPCSATPSSCVTGDKSMEKHKQKPPPCSATASSSVVDDKTMEEEKEKQKQQQKEIPPPCSATPQSATNGQTVESGVVPRSVVNCQTTTQNQPPPSGTGTGTGNEAGNGASTMVNCQTTVQNRPPPSGTGTGTGNAAGNGASTMVNSEKLFQPNSRLEALSQDSSVRGCWFKCVVLERNEQIDKIWVRYQDLQQPEGKGQLREWLKVARIAEPDHLGIRLAKRTMLRPQLPPRYRKIESPVDVGDIVDARLNGGWWEGIVLQQETDGLVQVYLQGEGRLVEFKVGDLRKSFEWREEQWMPLDARKDVAAKITLDLKKKKAASPAGLLQLQPREDKGGDGSVSFVPPRKRILEMYNSFEDGNKSKGPADGPAKTVPEKASLQQRREEGDGGGMSRGGGSADAKRPRVDPASSDLNCAEHKGKAGKSSSVKKMGSSEGSGSQGGTSGSASTGGAPPMKPVRMKEICVTNGEAPMVDMEESEVIDLTMDD